MRNRLLLASLLIVACDTPVSPDTDTGVEPGTDAPAADTSGTDAPGTDAPTPMIDGGMVESDTVSFGPHPIAPGEERTVCVVIDAGNDVARQVRAIRTNLPAGSHHMIVYRTDEPLDGSFTPCLPFSDGGSAVFIAETREAYLAYPADAALEFQAHQHIQIEVHEVNYTDGPIDITASVTFEYYPLDGTSRTPVQFLFTGDMSLNLPPHATTSVTSFHGVPTGARIFGLTSHTHSLGTYASIHRGTSESTYTELLHEADDWANPRLDTFAPPLVLDPSEGLRLQCDYENTTANPVGFGLGFDDEMCFLWAYYY